MHIFLLKGKNIQKVILKIQQCKFKLTVSLIIKKIKAKIYSSCTLAVNILKITTGFIKVSP